MKPNEHASDERTGPEGAEQDGQPLTDEYRHVLRDKITQGVKSLREGRVINGEEFMARMDSELAETERQEH